ncbi:MAG: glycosyltransferase family 52 [Porphyromonadaceae bacterium]|nr:glycosyltransferase family 52 [Porphyromonadaceae bacterium]
MNLIICGSPLQVLIAERIIDLHPNEDFYGIVYCYQLPPKLAYYYERLSRKCVKSRIIYGDQGHSKLGIYREILKLIVLGATLPKIKSVFIANIDIIDVCIFLHKASRGNIYTFDDGSINLCPDAFMGMVRKKIGGFQRILSCIFKIPTAEDLFRRSLTHYTLYDLPNVYSNTIKVELFHREKEVKGGNRDAIPREVRTLMLGQPIYEYGDEGEKLNIQITESVINSYQIECYIPHPREKYRVSNVEYINTNLISEDYLLENLERDPGLHYVIYTFCSTTALNLLGHHRIKFVAVKPKLIPSHLEEVYVILANAGIQIENQK